MKLLKKTNTTSLSSVDTFKMLFPEYGTKASEIPVYDSKMHMYIVDQHYTKGGHLQVTYVAVSGFVVAELTIGFYHSFTIQNKLRLLIPDGMGLKVVRMFEWPQTTYYNMDDVNAKIKEMMNDYVLDNVGLIAGAESEELKSMVRELADNLLKEDISAHQLGAGNEVLKAYCRQMKVCQDFTKNVQFNEFMNLR